MRRMRADTSSGAFGHVVPIHNTLTDMTLLAVLLAIVVVGVEVSILYQATTVRTTDLFMNNAYDCIMESTGS
jgi:hypothetical protein